MCEDTDGHRMPEGHERIFELKHDPPEDVYDIELQYKRTEESTG